MTDQPEAQQPESSNSVTNVSGGANLDAARDINIGGDVVGRDKIMTAGDDIIMGDQVEAETYIEHATIIQDRTNRLWLATLAGVVVVIIIVLGVVGTRPATTPAPVFTVIVPTDQPTTTPRPNTPTPTATPIFAAEVPYRVAIARFNQLSERKLAIEQRLEDDLDQQLQAAGLSDEVQVKVLAQPAVESAEDAQQLADKTGSSVVIWGLYDDVGIRLRVSLGSRATVSRTLPELGRFGELPLTDNASTLSFYITSTLPANTSFLSFYVIGHLYYLSNQYAKGYAAFDSAMTQLPRTVAVENEALLHFFKARSIDPTKFADAVNAACEYLQAIASNDQMFEAYNNLGTVIASHRVSFAQHLTPEQEAQLTACNKQNIFYMDPVELFNQALHIKPGLAIAEYNLGTIDWNQKASCMTNADCELSAETSAQFLQQREQAVAQFHVALQTDSSIPGAYLGLGNLAVWRQEFITATDYFSAAFALMPQSPETAFNLGQALALSGREADATAAYQTTLRLTAADSLPAMEAHLALGNLYTRQGKTGSAQAEYAQVQSAQARNPAFNPEDQSFHFDSINYHTARALTLAQAVTAIRAREWISASQYLEQFQQERSKHEGFTGMVFEPGANLDVYLKWLNTAAFTPTAALDSALPYTVTLDTTKPLFISWSYGNAATMAWYDLVKQCQQSPADDFRTWGSPVNPCLPADPLERFNAVSDIIQRRLVQRLFFNDVVPMGGMACPYIFTYDADRHTWSLDTTILYKLIGPAAETTQAHRLTRFDGRLLLREVEPEISYVDQIAMQLVTSDGRTLTLTLNDPLLGAADGRYLILHQGDEHLLTFDIPEEALPIREAWVIATGYYVSRHQE
jgi:tetratricopeptide (TPR) repeat protein